MVVLGGSMGKYRLGHLNSVEAITNDVHHPSKV